LKNHIRKHIIQTNKEIKREDRKLDGGKNMQKTLRRKSMALGIIILFIGGLLIPCSQSSSPLTQKNPIVINELTDKSTDSGKIKCYAFGKTESGKQEVDLSTVDAKLVFTSMKELETEMTQHPYSEKTQSLKIAFVDLLAEKGVISNGESKETYLSLLNPGWVKRLQNKSTTRSLPQPFANRGTCALCSVGGGGSGMIFPLFLLPRPRIAMFWVGTGLTTATNLLTTRGYAAGGAQTGFTLGFMGIGITYAVPGYMLYGFIGYALLASTTAEEIEYYPPNRAPEISDAQPADGEQNVPLSLTELQFRIQDADGNLMSYSVTTDPDIGSASGNLKPFGVYSVPVAGLQELTKYTWLIQVTDGKETTEKTMTFTTEPVSPIISNPLPENGERLVPSDLAELRFTLKDFQGDAMDFTVETSPPIGSSNRTGLHDGTYTVPVSGLAQETAYRWFVNVTDGSHWTQKTFSFVSGFPAHFNPFEHSWQYRKQITIDHTNVAGDLENFPVLLSIVDAELSQKAREHGEDILIMNSTGVSTRLNYEIESFDHDTGTLIAWVNIPHLSSTEDTSFYMYYGNPSCLPQQYPKKTWDSHYLAVWHMNDEQGAADSTNEHNATGVVDPIYHATGKIGFAETFSGNQYLQITKPNTMVGLSALSIEAWVKMSSNTTGSVIADMSDATYSGEAWRFLYVKESDSFLFRLGHSNPTNEEADALATGISLGTWYHFMGTWINGGKSTIYTNGVLSTQSTNAFTGMINRSDTDAFIGVEHSGSHTAFQNYLNGAADEIRISNIARSPSWILTSYTNQNNPSAFLGLGPEETPP
jgi:hypothetical protein